MKNLFLIFHLVVTANLLAGLLRPEDTFEKAAALFERGKYGEVEVLCNSLLVKSPQNPDLLTLLGDIYRETGRYDKAKSNYQQAMTIAPNHLQSRLNYGIMQWQWGEKREARQMLQHFISYYQSHRNLTADELNLVAQACIYLDRFRDANTLFNDATGADKNLWRAYIPWGYLMLAKYNVPDAQGIFQDALKINPNSAEAQLGHAKTFVYSNFDAARQEADKALAINPNFVAAHDFLAELEIALGRFSEALEILNTPLAVNPNSLTTRCQRALCFYFLEEKQKYSEEEARILQINPKYSDLYYQIAEVLAKRYLFVESIEFYSKALALDPENWPAYAGLGTSLSRTGKEKEAKQTLETAFAKDPFNKYVGNLLTLFDEFPDYKSHKTRHLTLRIHEKDDEVLSGYAKTLADASFEQLLAKYPIETNKEIILEIFPTHDDFAVRCFGLPGAQAFLGICFGNVVAMDSPRARTKGDFVWGETLWHELVHVTHLRLTANRIPRWLAEGIAVYETTLANPHWSMNMDLPFILALQNKQLLPLRDLDSGFNRPTNPGQVTLSYFQASLIVEYIVKEFGHKKLVETFPEFKEGKTTVQVIEDIFDKNVDDFDNDFHKYLEKKYRLNEVDFSLEPGKMSSDSESSENALLVQIRSKPANPFSNFRLGYFYKNQKEYEKAIPYLEKAKALFPEFVQHENPYEMLADIYLAKGEKAKAVVELKKLTSLNAKKIEALKQLADLCFALNDYDCAIETLTKALYITPFESEIHTKLAQAYIAKKDLQNAIAELQTNILTKPQDLAGAHCLLASAYLKAGKKNEARDAALSALEIAPDYEQAQEILLACRE